MLVVCVCVCLDEQMLTGKKRRQVAGSYRQLCFGCSQTMIYILFFWMCAFHFHHILVTGDWAVTAQSTTLCIWTILQLQQVMYELFRHVVCIDTSGSRRHEKEKRKRKKEKKERRKK